MKYSEVFHYKFYCPSRDWLAIKMCVPAARPTVFLVSLKADDLKNICFYQRRGVIGCRNLRTAYNGHPAETIVVLKVTRLLLLRISLKPSSYGKVDEARATSFFKKKVHYGSQFIRPKKKSQRRVLGIRPPCRSMQRRRWQQGISRLCVSVCRRLP